MKTLTVVFSLFILTNISFAGELVMSGIYQGKNLYVQNPYNPDKRQFCTNEVFVNDRMVLTGIKSSAYTINLSHLEQGSIVVIKITYKNDCTPKIINAFVLQKPDQNYTFNPISIAGNNISWSLKEEVVAGRFIIEKYTDNYWKPIATTSVAPGEPGYSKSIENYFTEGFNKFRVKYLTPDERVFISANISQQINADPITFSLTSSNKIVLSKESSYEIVDAEGNKVSDGKGNEIAISDLNPGVYYINYANKSEKFLKE